MEKTTETWGSAHGPQIQKSDSDICYLATAGFYGIGATHWHGVGNLGGHFRRQVYPRFL